MAKTIHPHYAAAKMAATEMKDLMSFIKDSEYGNYPESGESAETARRHKMLANAPADIRRLLDEGHSMEFVERLARQAHEREVAG